jgi:uncharacterized membrane protein
MYGIFCMVLALIFSAVYVQLRNVQPKRVATLRPRRPESVIPWWIFAIAVLSALTVLSYLNTPAFAAGAVAVCISSFVCIVAAWRLTKLPALLQGVDVPMETFVDERLRFQRSITALFLAIVQPFVFSSQALGVDTPMHWKLYFFTMALWLILTLWAARKLLQRGSLLEAK